MGVEYQVISIEPVYEAFMGQLMPVFAGKKPDVTEENLQSRTRGVMLMTLSNKHSRLLLATGNKSEMAVGYATLYGDMCGVCAIISGGKSTAAAKFAALERARATTVKSPADLGKTLAGLLKK